MTDHAATIVVDLHDGLPDVLDRLRGAGGRPATLAIPAGSSLFLTASEFRALKDAAERLRTPLVVETADPLRAQLAAMFDLDGDPSAPTEDRGVEPGQLPSPAPTAAVDRSLATWPRTAEPPGRSTPDAPEAAAEPKVRPITPLRPPHLTPLPTPPAHAERSVADHTRGERRATSVAAVPPIGSDPDAVADDRAWPAAAEPGSPPAAALGTPADVETAAEAATGTAPQPAPGQSATGDEKGNGRTGDVIGARTLNGDAAGPDHAALAGWPSPSRAGAWRHRVGSRTIAVAVAVLVVAAVIAAVAASLLLPRATVAITLKRQAVSGELVYDIAAAGAPARAGAALTVPAQPFSAEVTFDAAIPTTGSRLKPEKTAKGTVVLNNPGSRSVTVAAGTKLTGDNGVVYVVPGQVLVPAADRATHRNGLVNAPVQAAEPGLVGNLEIGALDGRLDSGVYYSNREGPIAGGTDTPVPAVAAADLETLRTKAEAGLPKSADQAAQGRLPAGEQAISASLTLGRPSYGYDHAAGDSARSVAIHVVLPVTGLTYDPQTALAQATDRLDRQLAARAPAGYSLDARSVKIDGPMRLAEQASGVRFRIAATAVAAATLTDPQRQEIRHKLAGKGGSDVAAVLRAVPGVDHFTVSYSPRWLPDRMPASVDRIHLDVTDGSG